MTNVTRNMPHDITYWDPNGHDRYGKTLFQAPVHLKGRWEDRTEVVMGKNSQDVTSRSRVYLVQDVDLDGFLFYGISNDADPTILDGAFEIQMTGKQSDLRDLKQLSVAYL
jgi:hypothetical protein